jgi:hypothetical protein
MVIYYHILLFL